MIAEPSPTSGHPSVPEEPSVGVSVSASENPLTEHEVHQLTLYKWRYSLEAYGFDASQVRKLMFVKWLQVTQRVQP